MNGEYAYELNVIHNHLSEEKALNFIYKNIDEMRSKYVLMHRHMDK